MKNYLQKIMFIPLYGVIPCPQPRLNRLALVSEIISLLHVLNPHTKSLKILSRAHVLQKDPHGTWIRKRAAHRLPSTNARRRNMETGFNRSVLPVSSENSRFKVEFLQYPPG